MAREAGVPVLARGGGTSQCGQTVNRALVLDCSKHLRPGARGRWRRDATVQPGIVLAHLNAALKPHGLFFPVDPSTQARCTIGGMAANNSCGSKSIRYGLMADNVRAIDAILADGTRHRFGRCPTTGRACRPAWPLVQRLRALGAAEADEIAARFPHQLRRVGGYNIEALTPRPRREGRENLARLLVGSRGHAGVLRGAGAEAAPLQPRKMVGICQFPSFRAAMEASRHLVALDPEAVELVDRTMIDLGRGIPIYRRRSTGCCWASRTACCWSSSTATRTRRCWPSSPTSTTLMADLGYPGAVVRAADPAFQAAIAEVREAGLNIMMSMKGDGKPVSFIEDCAVDLDDLADYTERLNDVFARHGTKGTWYAHASVGCLHVRPVLNMKDPADVRTMRAVAEECFALVREYKGSHSGEHGDGIVRSEFHEGMFGARIVRAFEAVKDAFDPAGLLNPGRVVRPPRMDDRRCSATRPATPPTRVHAGARLVGASARRARRAAGAVEMCNNNGTCRKFDAGRDVPELPRHPRRGAPDARPGQHAAAGADRAARAGRDGRRRRGGGDGAVRVLQGVPARVPDRRGHGEDEDRGCRPRAAAARRGLRDRLVAELPRYGRVARGWRRWPTCATACRRWRGWASGCGLAAARPCPPGAATASATTRPDRRRATCCCWPTRSTAISSRRTCARRCACCAPPGSGRSVRQRRRAAAVLRPHLSVRRHGGPRPRRGGAHPGGAGRRPAGGRAGAVLPADAARRVRLAAAGEARGAGRPGDAARRVPGAPRSRTWRCARARDGARARALPPEGVRRLSGRAGRCGGCRS